MNNIILLPIFILLFSLYFYISYSFFEEYNYIHSNLLYFCVRALIALQNDLRFEYIGFVYPPVAFVPFILLNDPLITPGLVSSLFTIFFFYLLRKNLLTNNYSIIVFALLCLNPLYIYLSCYEFYILLFYVFLVFSVFYIVSYLQKQYSYYLFISGILLGFTFYVNFFSIFLIPIFLLIFLLSLKELRIFQRLAILIVYTSPLIFFFTSWIYLNWVYTGDPFHFLSSPYSIFKSEKYFEALPSSYSLLDSLKTLTLFVIQNLPIILPYFFVFFHLTKFRHLYSIPLFLTYIIPLFLLFFSIHFKLFFPHFYTSILFLLFAFTFSFIIKKPNHKILLLLFIVSFLASFYLPIFSKDSNEQFFISNLSGKKINASLGKNDDIEIAKILNDLNCTKILTDDSVNFPVIYFYRITRNFILQHNYEFYSALSNPFIFADCVLISNHRRDIIIKSLPDTKKGFLKGFYLYFENKSYKVFVNPYRISI